MRNKTPNTQTLIRKMFEYSEKETLKEYGRKRSEIEWEKKTPIQKIGIHMRTVVKELKEIEKMLINAKRLKNEHGLSKDKYWKRTQKSFLKIETKMRKLMHRLKDLQE